MTTNQKPIVTHHFYFITRPNHTLEEVNENHEYFRKQINGHSTDFLQKKMRGIETQYAGMTAVNDDVETFHTIVFLDDPTSVLPSFKRFKEQFTAFVLDLKGRKHIHEKAFPALKQLLIKRVEKVFRDINEYREDITLKYFRLKQEKACRLARELQKEIAGIRPPDSTTITPGEE